MTPADDGERAVHLERFLGGQLGLRHPAFLKAHLPRPALPAPALRPARPLRRRVRAVDPTHQLRRRPATHEQPPVFGAPLADWEAFVSLVVPMGESAHRFTGALAGSARRARAEQRQILERARPSSPSRSPPTPCSTSGRMGRVPAQRGGASAPTRCSAHPAGWPPSSSTGPPGPLGAHVRCGCARRTHGLADSSSQDLVLRRMPVTSAARPHEGNRP